MGADDTVISQIRWDGIQLRFFDSNNPEVLDVGAYFDTGAGNAQTLYLATKDGTTVTTESFAAATYLASSNTAARVDFVNLPTAVETLLDGLSVGDRFIISGGRVAVDHAVDADPVTVAYAVPQPGVTHMAGHAVNANPVTVTYAVPRPTVRHVSIIPDIVTADWNSTGYETPIVLAVLQATVTNNFLTVVDVTPNEGELDVASDLTFGRVERHAGGPRLYRDTGSTARGDAYFDTTGDPTYPDALFFIQTTADGVARYNIAASGQNVNLTLESGENASVLANIITGDYFLLAIAELSPVVVPPPPSDMRLWLERLRLPWVNLPERWKLTEFKTDLAQRLVDESSLALREWSPLTCRPQTLQTWGETLRRPQRDGESTADYRVRLLTYRTEPVGQSPAGCVTRWSG